VECLLVSYIIYINLVRSDNELVGGFGEPQNFPQQVFNTGEAVSFGLFIYLDSVCRSFDSSPIYILKIVIPSSSTSSET
jgi:hypothetical protein